MLKADGWPHPATEWTDLDLGRAFREALNARPEGWSRPSLMSVTEGWEASSTYIGNSRRFHHSLRATSRSPETALLELADKLFREADTNGVNGGPR